MAGVILENISTKKLVLICLFLFGLSLACFIMGGVKVPNSVHTQTVGGNWCVRQFDKKGKETEWYPSRGPGKCVKIEDLSNSKVRAQDISFSFQYPLPRDDMDLKMSRWFMYHVTVLSLDIRYQEGNTPENDSPVDLVVKIGYRNENTSSWQELLPEEEVNRQLRCDDIPEKQPGYKYNCDFMDLFEIGNMHHEEYLVNIRIPPNEDTGSNMKLGQVDSVDLVWFAQTGGFTLYFLVMKTVCFALVLPLTIWNWKRVADLNRSPVFLEKFLLILAVAAIILNFPVDWLVLVIEMKFMLLWSDIRQGVFLSILLGYWLVFTGEHMIDNVKRGTWGSYWKQLASVILASSLMFIFDMCERGVRLTNPFFSLWATPKGAMLGKAFIGIAIAASILYCIILLVLVIKTIYNLWHKRSQFKTMAKGLRVHYMSVIYRFYFTLIFSAVCSLLTVIAFAMGQIYESEWKWDFDMDDYGEDGYAADDNSGYITKSLKGFEINSAFQLGVYATWNVYVMAMLIFYAPSHKKTAALDVSVVGDDDNDEHVELTAVPSTSGTTRARTSAAASIDHSDELTDETVNLTTGHNVVTEGVSQIHTLANKALVD